MLWDIAVCKGEGAGVGVYIGVGAVIIIGSGCNKIKT